MTEKIRVNYAALEDMANHCLAVEQTLQQTASNAQKWGQMMRNGALQGPTGEVFVEALEVFSKKVLQLGAKFNEEYRDIKAAMEEMRQADSQAGGNF